MLRKTTPKSANQAAQQPASSRSPCELERCPYNTWNKLHPGVFLQKSCAQIILGICTFHRQPSSTWWVKSAQKLMQEKDSKPCGNFFSLFWCSSPSTSDLTCVIRALLNPSSPTPKSSRPPPQLHFDCQFNPVSYFYNLLGTFALFSLNGKATGGGTRNICWVGLHSLSRARANSFPSKTDTKATKTKGSLKCGGWMPQCLRNSQPHQGILPCS